MFRVGSRLLSVEKPAASISAARLFTKGLVYGGLGGGLLGLAIELSPEELGLRPKARDLAQWALRILEGKPLVDAPSPAPLVDPPRTAPNVEVIVPSPQGDGQDKAPVVVKVGTQEKKEEDHVPQKDTADAPPLDDTVDKALSPETTSAPVEVTTRQEKVSEPEAATSSEHPIEEDESTPRDEPDSVTTTPHDGPHSDETPHGDDSDMITSLKEQISTLQAEISELHSEAELEEHRRAGVDRATIETMDRLYGERQKALGLAKQSLAVLSLLEDVAGDKRGLSLGALRVDFEEAAPEMIKSCFLPAKPSMGSWVVGNMLAGLYSVSAGDALGELPHLVDNSSTWQRLRALHRARRAVKAGDLVEACMHLHALESVSPDAKIWREKALTAAQVYHGATAAIAHMYDDLARIM